MPADKIRVMIKEPGETWERREVDNTLRTFVGLVGGHIETIPVQDDLLLIVNNVAVLRELEPNLYVRGHWLRGTVVAVGVDGENFGDCPAQSPWKMRIAISLANARRAQ